MQGGEIFTFTPCPQVRWGPCNAPQHKTIFGQFLLHEGTPRQENLCTTIRIWMRVKDHKLRGMTQSMPLQIPERKKVLSSVGMNQCHLYALIENQVREKSEFWKLPEKNEQIKNLGKRKGASYHYTTKNPVHMICC